MEPQIAYICREILIGIKLLHDHRLAHRDLKSANIMIDLDANVKLSTSSLSFLLLVLCDVLTI